MWCCYSACVVSMTIRNVPSETRDRLAERADRAGQSLQEYLRTWLIDVAGSPSPDDFLAEVRSRVERSDSRVSTESTLEALREARAGR